MSSRESESEIPLVPAAYAVRFVALVEERGFAAEQVLHGTRLSRGDLDDPARRLTLAEIYSVFDNGTRLTGDMSLGLEIGLSLKASSHGLLGLALLTCNSLRDALMLGERYIALRTSPWQVTLIVEGELAILRFVETYSLGAMRIIGLEMVLGGAIRLGEFMTGFSFTHPDIEFWYDGPEPAHHARFRDRAPRVRYECPTNEGRFPAAWLDRPLVLHDPVANRETLTVLERERRLLVDSADLVAHTRAVLADPGARFPSLDEVARRLHISSRSLRRHLSEAGTSFQSLRDEVRRTRSTVLLDQSRLSIDEVARELGFADAAGFGRAFQRWTGETPSNYRRRRKT